ncbi:hypothetical protein O1M07_02355 [Streptomyces albulus]|nr:hypothetical protein [Streptomyces noursei]
MRCIRRILRTVRDAMTPSTRLLVVDAVLPVDGTPRPAIPLDIVMPRVLKGRERTAARGIRSGDIRTARGGLGALAPRIQVG